MHPAILSLHDVMPDAIGRLEEILKYLEDHRIPPITLLVVPGLKWRPYQIKLLQQLVDRGFELAAHGWAHHVKKPSGIYHQLHAAALSRNVAEHLALDPDEILTLMVKSHAWFNEHELPAPRLYVPPAWALGNLSREQLRQLPYSRIEIIRGILCTETGKVLPLPLVGFEADTACRAGVLKLWNKWQFARGRWSGKPVRIGLHPNDFHLRLAREVRQALTHPFIWQSYGEALDYVCGSIPSPA